MDLDVGYSVGLSMNMASSGSVSQGGSVDMMSFGVPELGVGYQFDPSAHSHVALEFSEEELAIMDQICRQQGGNLMYPGPIGLQVG